MVDLLRVLGTMKFTRESNARIDKVKVAVEGVAGTARQPVEARLAADVVLDLADRGFSFSSAKIDAPVEAR